jgi:hypothetical protein
MLALEYKAPRQTVDEGAMRVLTLFGIALWLLAVLIKLCIGCALLSTILRNKNV